MDTDLLPRDGLILCAVSGGADSVYLLLRLTELGYTVAAAHYDHMLRGAASERDAAFVRNLCREQGVPFVSERGDVLAFARREKLGVEEAARYLRYAFLERAADAMGAAVIATAHTANDNAETVLLSLARGTGLRGLGGIPPRRGRIVRPMLDVTRREVEDYLRGRGAAWVEDATNADDRYARNRVRHGAVPALETVDPAFVRAVGRTAALCREDEALLTDLARTFVREHGGENWLDAQALAAAPWPVASRAVRLVAGRALTAEHVRAVLKIARDGGAADVPGLRAARAGERLVFGVKTAPPLPERTLPLPGRVLLPEAGMVVTAEKFTGCPQVVHKSYNIFYFQCENICGSITVAGRRPGDRFRPAGRGCTKTLKQLLLEAGVPAWERDGVPVLRDEKGILAVYGVGPAERACSGGAGGEMIKIEIVRLEPDGEGKT